MTYVEEQQMIKHPGAKKPYINKWQPANHRQQILHFDSNILRTWDTLIHSIYILCLIPFIFIWKKGDVAICLWDSNPTTKITIQHWSHTAGNTKLLSIQYKKVWIEICDIVSTLHAPCEPLLLCGNTACTMWTQCFCVPTPHAPCEPLILCCITACTVRTLASVTSW